MFLNPYRKEQGQILIGHAVDTYTTIFLFNKIILFINNLFNCSLTSLKKTFRFLWSVQKWCQWSYVCFLILIGTAYKLFYSVNFVIILTVTLQQLEGNAFFESIRETFCGTVDPLQLAQYLVEQNCLTVTDLVGKKSNKTVRMYFVSGFWSFPFHFAVFSHLWQIWYQEFTANIFYDRLGKTFLKKERKVRKLFESNHIQIQRLYILLNND